MCDWQMRLYVLARRSSEYLEKYMRAVKVSARQGTVRRSVLSGIANKWHSEE